VYEQVHKFAILYLSCAGTHQIVCPSTLFLYDPFCTYTQVPKVN